MCIQVVNDIILFYLRTFQMYTTDIIVQLYISMIFLNHQLFINFRPTLIILL